jgi:NitT/TauT family transport system permease protein
MTLIAPPPEVKEPKAYAPSPKGPLTRLRRSFARTIVPLLALAFIVLLWQLWVDLAHIKEFLLPSPTAIAQELAASWSSILAQDTWVTLQETLAGFGLGAVLGFVLAIGITYSRFLERVLYPLIVASQAVPKVAVAPLFVVWLGFGIWPKIAVTMTLVFFPIVVTAAQGLMSVDTGLLELLRSVDANPWQTFRKVRLPHALPSIMSGMKIGMTLAVVGAVVGEWVGANAGLGYLILYAQSQLETRLTFAAIAVLVVMGVVLFMLVDLLGRLITPWSSSDQPVAATY